MLIERPCAGIVLRFPLKIVSSLLLCLFSAAASAQTPQQPTQPSSGASLHLNVVVTPKSKSGEPVANLDQSAFTVLDNGHPEPITSFRAVSGAADPVKTFLVIDAININYTRLAYEREQVAKFLKAGDGKLATPTALAVVTDTNVEATGFTTDGHALNATLDSKEIGLRDIRRSSGFYGAEDRLGISLRALREMITKAGSLPGRKAIFWVSPGWPLLSGPAVELTSKQAGGVFQQVMTISREIRESNVTLYSVDPLGAGESPERTFYYEQFVKAVRKPSEVQLGDLSLQVLATQSGGLALSSSNDTAALLQRCEDDTRSSYEIGYRAPPADAPNEFHEIQVKVAGPPLVARTRQGYYSEP